MRDYCLVGYNRSTHTTRTFDVGYGQLKRTRVASCLCNNHFFFSCYSHQSISDYSWEVYIVHSGVFCRMSLHA